MQIVDFVEACYEPIQCDTAWFRHLARQIAPLLLEGDVVACYRIATTGSQVTCTSAVGTVAAEALQATTGFTPHTVLAKSMEAGGERHLKAVAGSLHPVRVECTNDLPAPLADRVRRCLPPPYRDSLTVFGRIDPGDLIVVSELLVDEVRLSPTKRAQLSSLGAHIRIGELLRRQRRDWSPLAKTRLSGRLLDVDPAQCERAQRTRLSDAIVALERARLRPHKTTSSTLQLGAAVLAGEYTLVEAFDRDGQRHVLVVATGLPQHKPLSAREDQVVQLIGRGFSNKETGYRLSITASTVSAHLGAAMRKLRCRDRGTLTRRYAVATRLCWPGREGPLHG